ncbi:MAG TPA: hypothetical protein VFF30_16800 [Nitrososphaerales archaeon]|nr:hypothetical protein [Nitrososphaerales archaeon]
MWNEAYDAGIGRLTGELRQALSSTPLKISTLTRESIPAGPGVYVIFEALEPVYVGSSGNLRRRVLYDLLKVRRHYLSIGLRDRLYGGDRARAIDHLMKCSIAFFETETGLEAEWSERFFSSILRGKYNQWKALKKKGAPEGSTHGHIRLR